MPCTSTLYENKGAKWKSLGSTEVKKQGGSAESHAERTAYKSGKGNPILIVQDAFPCYDKCHAFFLQTTQKGTVSVIIKVTADASYDGRSYGNAKGSSGDIAEAVPASFPYYFYYHKGALTISSQKSNAPAGFPKHPVPDAEV